MSSEERDHQVSEKFSLQDEVKSTIDSKVGIDAGVTSTIKYGEVVSITPHANVTANFSKSQAESTARSYAKEIVDRSATKVQEKVRRLTVSKMISETEERNKHVIDNTQAGNVHRAGLYYWVNRVSHAQVFNYGKHMMFDAILPEPAALFKKLYADKILLDKNKNEPPKPSETPSAFQRNTYGGILSTYGISSTEELQPPDPGTAVQVAFSQNVAKPDGDKEMGFSSNEFKTPEIPRATKPCGWRLGPAYKASMTSNAIPSCRLSLNVTATRKRRRSFSEFNGRRFIISSSATPSNCRRCNGGRDAPAFPPSLSKGKKG